MGSGRPGSTTTNPSLASTGSERSSPEGQPSDRIAIGLASSADGAVMEEEGESDDKWQSSNVSAGQRMLSAVTGSILTSLLGPSNALLCLRFDDTDGWISHTP